MELLDYVVYAAALANFCIRRNVCSLEMEKDDCFFNFSDYFLADYEDATPPPTHPQLAAPTPTPTPTPTPIPMVSSAVENTNIRNAMPLPKMEEGSRIAFRTLTEIDNLDDGFKWRKYGKKSVKNSPNPRNYYRCSTEGCFVKKRVEREKEDPKYVVTTYEGIHNHSSPGIVYHATQDTLSGRFFLSDSQPHEEGR